MVVMADNYTKFQKIEYEWMYVSIVYIDTSFSKDNGAASWLSTLWQFWLNDNIT